VTLPWRTSSYCISSREADAPEHVTGRTWMRRRPCCDCGETVIYAPAPLSYELLCDYLIICKQCAHERLIEAGDMSWTYTVEPRPRPNLD
jgi:hypothetical protein